MPPYIPQGFEGCPLFLRAFRKLIRIDAVFGQIFALYDPQSRDNGRILFELSVILISSGCPVGFAPFGKISLLAFARLHFQCANCKLLMSDGWPLRSMGIM